MLFIAFFAWWYGPGWSREIVRVKDQLAAVSDTFSIELLVTTLFSPFRQISVGKVDGPLEVIIRAWLDRLISRLIGAMVRSFMIVFGVVSLLAVVIVAGIRIAIWPFLPFVPVISLILALMGWLP